MKKKLCALLASALALSLVLTGCGNSSGSAQSSASSSGNTSQSETTSGPKDEVVTMAIISTWNTLNIYNTSGNYGNCVADQMFERLVTNAGGPAPNVIQDYAEMVYNIRAYTHKKAVAAAQWVEDIAKGAAMMSRTRVEVLYEGGLSELIPNRTLERIAYEKFLEVGPTPYSREDLEFCTKIHDTFPAGAEESTCNNLSYLYGKTAQQLIPQIKGKMINDIIYPYTEIPHAKYGSTDVCDVSWFTPTMQVTTACYAKDTPGHSWQQVAQGKRPLCYNGMMTAAKVMALTGAELASCPEKVRAMREEFQSAMKGRVYECPLPLDAKPGGEI